MGAREENDKMLGKYFPTLSFREKLEVAVLTWSSSLLGQP